MPMYSPVIRLIILWVYGVMVYVDHDKKIEMCWRVAVAFNGGPLRYRQRNHQHSQRWK